MAGRDLTWHAAHVTRDERWAAIGARGATVWITGLSGSGKSTLAAAVEERLVRAGQPAYRLDGDNVRSGLNSDLGFTHEDRDENVRRVAEVARLCADAGMVVLVALISPFAEARRRARVLHEESGLPFLEVYVSTALSECESRDPKGLYVRAAEGDIANFTGVSDHYEPPTDPDLLVAGADHLEDSVTCVLDALAKLGIPPVRPASS